MSPRDTLTVVGMTLATLVLLGLWMIPFWWHPEIVIKSTIFTLALTQMARAWCHWFRGSDDGQTG